MGSGAWFVKTYGDVTGFIFFIFELINKFINTINIKIPINIGNGVTAKIPIFTLLVVALAIALIASVFVKGARG